LHIERNTFKIFTINSNLFYPRDFQGHQFNNRGTLQKQMPYTSYGKSLETSVACPDKI